ncbi:MAG TPA: tetratricopeptide repeat protein [Pyrinomonadaceae bacterium]|jgi:superkiller protein 3
MSKLSVYLASICVSLTLCVSSIRGQLDQSSQGQKPQTIEEARRLLEAGKTDAAIDLLTNASKTSNKADISYLLGLAYHQKRDYVDAVEYLSATIKAMPETDGDYNKAIQLLGISHYLLGHHKEAIPYLEKTNRLIPDSDEITYALGVCYIQTRSTDKSREAFARMFKVQPTSAAAYVLNAQMMVRQQFEELAEPELNRALELDPKVPQANFLLGEIAIYHAQIDRGIALMQKEIEINPAFALAYYWLGEAYSRQLKWDSAIAPLQKSIWLNPYFSGPYIVLGKVYLKKEDLLNAESMLRRATQLDPNNFSAHHLLAQVLQRANRPEEAKQEFQTAEKLRTSADKQQ